MDYKVGARLRNRYDIIVEDVKTGEVIQRAGGENIVLDSMIGHLQSTASAKYGSYIIYGTGTGTLSTARTILFNRLGHISSLTDEEIEMNLPGVESKYVRKGVILADTHTGATLTEVGLSNGSSSTNIVTHAFLEDSEGNPITIGPLTDTQQVTIYATTYATITSSESNLILLIPEDVSDGTNALLGSVLGYIGPQRLNSSGTTCRYHSLKYLDITERSVDAPGGYLAPGATFVNHNAGTKTSKTNRLRLDTNAETLPIWSYWFHYYVSSPSSSRRPLCLIRMPTTAYSGHQFVGKAIGTGDGTTTEFTLPWGDINEIKSKTWYVDGVATGATITVNAVNNTKIQFASAPALNAPITGDWWVDYVPKDDQHVFDVTLTIVYSWT